MKKKDKYKRMKQDTRTDKDSLTSRVKKGKISPYPGKIRPQEYLKIPYHSYELFSSVP